MQNNEEINISKFKQYLLGNLAPPEIEAIDLQIIADGSSEEELYRAESELMEDYLDKTLSPTETELFRENFLVSAERKAQLKQISQIRNYARNAVIAASAGKAAGKQTESFIEKLRNFFSLNLKATTAVFALLLIGSIAVGIFYYTTSNQTELERDFAQLNWQDLGNSAELKNIYAVDLMSGAFRDSTGAIKQLPPDKLTEKVLFKLALPVTPSAADTYKVELVKDRTIVFTQTNQRFYNNPNGQELRLFMPAPLLKKGAYQIKVSSEAAKNSTFIYDFAVE